MSPSIVSPVRLASRAEFQEFLSDLKILKSKCPIIFPMQKYLLCNATVSPMLSHYTEDL